MNLNQMLASHLNCNFEVVQSKKLNTQDERNKQQAGNGWQKQETNTNNR